jgi:hypothetical protein
VAHGDLDTLVLVEDARRFVDGLRRFGGSGCVRGVARKHAFDLFHSIRFESHRCDRGLRSVGESRADR